MKKDLNNFQSQNIKTGCSILELMVLVIITQPLEGRLLANESGITNLIGISIYCALLIIF